MTNRQARKIFGSLKRSERVAIWLVGNSNEVRGVAVYDDGLNLIVVDDDFYVAPQYVAAVEIGVAEEKAATAPVKATA